jgi:hypothetical protein
MDNRKQVLFAATLFLACSPIAWAQANISFTAEELKFMGLEGAHPDAIKLKLLVPYMSQKLAVSRDGPTQANSPPASTPTKLVATTVGAQAKPDVSAPALTAPSVTGGLTPQPSIALPIAQSKAIPETADAGNKTGNDKRLTKPVEIARTKSGLEVDGKAVSDPDGQVGLYAFDAVSGSATYLANTSSPGRYIIKSSHLGTDEPPTTLAKAVETGNGWTVTTESGEEFSGEAIIPASEGFVVIRGGQAFLFTPGKGVKPVNIPSGYRIAPFQNGDVSTTRYLLLEKLPSGPKNDLLELGVLIGMAKKEDYALLDVDSGLPLYINMSADGKQHQVLSNCYRRSANSIVNTCKTMNSYELLYNPSNGLPNYTHYYWRLYWFKVPDGRRVVIAQEGGLSTVSIINMDTGSRATLFERFMGIAGFSARVNGRGKLEVTAKMGLTRERIEDALAVLDGTPPKPVEVGGISLF